MEITPSFLNFIYFPFFLQYSTLFDTIFTRVKPGQKTKFNKIIPQISEIFKYTKKRTVDKSTVLSIYPSDFLLSQAAARQVSSALRSLTSVFGMGTGVTSALLSLSFN